MAFRLKIYPLSASLKKRPARFPTLHASVKAIVTPGEYEGLRITPNLYTTLEEIDTFTDVTATVIKRGSIPS